MCLPAGRPGGHVSVHWLHVPVGLETLHCRPPFVYISSLAAYFRGVLRYRFTLTFLKLLTLGAPDLTRRITLFSSKKQISCRSIFPWPKYTKTSFFETRLAFRRFWVKEPRHSEKKVAEMYHLYRSLPAITGDHS